MSCAVFAAFAVRKHYPSVRSCVHGIFVARVPGFGGNPYCKEHLEFQNAGYFRGSEIGEVQCQQSKKDGRWGPKGKSPVRVALVRHFRRFMFQA